jgi:hypothetical protein
MLWPPEPFLQAGLWLGGYLLLRVWWANDVPEPAAY